MATNCFENAERLVSKAQPQPNILTFDIEDWFHLCGIEHLKDASKWRRMPSLVEPMTREILDILDRFGARATFFLLGWTAERHPELVREIARRGHELASHGYSHSLVYTSTPSQFREDLKRSIDVVQRISGERVRGYRAPSFSIRNGCEWAFEIIADLGFTYDASLFPTTRGQGGYRGIPDSNLYRLNLPSGARLFELPMSAVRFGRLRVPFTGGGYLRLFPASLITAFFRRLNSRRQPGIIYLHPRDLTPH